MTRMVITTRITFYVLSVGLSRLCLAYGGSDVTRTLFWLLQRAGFPYRDCQLSSRLDCQLLQHLKETFCHLDQVCWSGVLGNCSLYVNPFHSSAGTFGAV